MKKSHVLEHTPIYNIDEYQQRNRHLKRQKLLKNLFNTAMYFCWFGLALSLFFWGA